MANAVKWVDDTERVRWQPATDNGDKAWWITGLWDPDIQWANDEVFPDYPPVLYYSRCLALRRARREERVRARMFRPAQDAGCA